VPDADSRRRVLEAAYACVARFGFAKTAVDDVAKEAGCSRATVYRMFPGGKDELLGAMVGWEMDRFFVRMADAVAGAGSFAAVMEAALRFAHAEIGRHAVLQTVLATEPDRLLPYMTVEQDRILGAVTAYLRPLLRVEADAGRVQPGVDLDTAADYVARLGLSVMATPGRIDLADPAAVHDLVQRLLLGGIVVGRAGDIADVAGVAAPSGPPGA